MFSRKEFERGVDRAVPFLTATGLVAAVFITALSDVPSKLPGIALGSTALFYFERGVAAMAATVIGLMLLVRGLKEEVPSEASPTGLGYKVQEAVAGSDAALSDLKSRLDKLDEVARKQQEGLSLLLSIVRDVVDVVRVLRDKLEKPTSLE